jgi:hypothetical protein
MAKPITATPPVTGEAARRIQEEIRHGTPDTPERLAFLRESDQVFAKIRSQLTPPPQRQQ